MWTLSQVRSIKSVPTLVTHGVEAISALATTNPPHLAACGSSSPKYSSRPFSKNDSIVFCSKVFEGLVPAVPPEHFLTQQRPWRLVCFYHIGSAFSPSKLKLQETDTSKITISATPSHNAALNWKMPFPSRLEPPWHNDNAEVLAQSADGLKSIGAASLHQETASTWSPTIMPMPHAWMQAT